MAPKWRIAFLHVNVAPKTLHFVELAYMLAKRYCFIGIYKPYTQSAESIISILVLFGLLWLQLSDTFRKFKPE